MKIDFEPGWLCVCLSQRPGHAPIWQVAVGGLSLCRTKIGEHPAFVRRTNTRTKVERLRAVRVCPVPFGFRQAASGFRRCRTVVRAESTPRNALHHAEPWSGQNQHRHL